MNKEAKTVGEVALKLISETKGPSSTQPTTMERSQEIKRQKVWLETWLGLQKGHHKALVGLETSFYDFCGKIWQNPGVGSTMVIYGPNGCGKTHCAKKLKAWIAHVGPSRQTVPKKNHESFLQARYWYWPALLDVFKEGGWDALDDMMETSVLILDDIGAAHDPSRVGVDKLGQLLTRRERMWNLITTNIAPENWETVFDRRVASRLARNSEIIDLSSVPDFSLVEQSEHPVI